MGMPMQASAGSIATGMGNNNPQTPRDDCGHRRSIQVCSGSSRDHRFEARNSGVLFVGLLRAKSAGGEGRDPDFAFHEDVLINNDRFRPVDTPTTRARAVEIERLHVLATQSRQRRVLAPAYREETFLRLIEWAQSQSLH